MLNYKIVSSEINLSDLKYMKSLNPRDGWFEILPEPHREISLDEYLQISNIWIPSYYCWIQCRLKDEKAVKSGFIHFNHLYGYGVLIGNGKVGVDKFGKQCYLNSSTARYFKFGCEHENAKELPSVGRCQHDFECLKCGVKFGYDSGD
jgi:hypothetical protein